MLSDQETREPLPAEAAVSDTVTCEGYCEDEVFDVATVDVVAGAIVGEWTDPEPHLGVAGVESDAPETQQWCVSCAEERFGIGRSARDKRMETVTRYVTAHTVTAFALGVVLTLLASVVMFI